MSKTIQPKHFNALRGEKEVFEKTWLVVFMVKNFFFFSVLLFWHPSLQLYKRPLTFTKFCASDTFGNNLAKLFSSKRGGGTINICPMSIPSSRFYTYWVFYISISKGLLILMKTRNFTPIATYIIKQQIIF